MSHWHCSAATRFVPRVMRNFRHLWRSSAAISLVLKSRPVHSLMLSSHLFSCLPLFLLSGTVPCRTFLQRPLDLVTCPNHRDFVVAVLINISSSDGTRDACGPFWYRIYFVIDTVDLHRPQKLAMDIVIRNGTSYVSTLDTCIELNTLLSWSQKALLIAQSHWPEYSTCHALHIVVGQGRAHGECVQLTHCCKAWALTRTVIRIINGFNSRCLHVITGKDYRTTATTPVYDLVLAVRKRRMSYLSYVLRLPPDRIVRRSLVALVKGGTYYPEGSLFSDCTVDGLHQLIMTATNRSAWRAKVASLTR